MGNESAAFNLIPYQKDHTFYEHFLKGGSLWIFQTLGENCRQIF